MNTTRNPRESRFASLLLLGPGLLVLETKIERATSLVANYMAAMLLGSENKLCSFVASQGKFALFRWGFQLRIRIDFLLSPLDSRSIGE